MRPRITSVSIEKPNLTVNEQKLVEFAIQGINERYANVSEQKIPHEMLIKRAAYELNIIINMGFADYLLIVSDYLKIGLAIGHMPDDRIEYLRAHMQEMSIQEMMAYIEADQTYPGMTIGLGRGSAAGSIVAYALHITNLEPITYGLLFERFLNPERVSMPDIDSDLSNAKVIYGVRDIVIEYVSKKYGKDAVCSIVTKATLKAKAAIDEVTRVMMSKQAQTMGISVDDEQLKREFYSLADNMKSLIPTDDPNVTFSSEVTDGVTVADTIRNKFAGNERALQILEYAVQLEGVNINYGKHAAGVVIADNGDVGAYGALMYDEEIGWKFQMDGPDVEGMAGLLKMDFLGLTTLNTITAAVRYIRQNTGIYIDCDNIPDEPEVYKEIFSKANTFGVFQFESEGAKKILKNFKPDCFEDLIIINAINRPGPAQYIEPITLKKHGQKVSETAFDKIPQIQDILAPTYGYPVYQEQVMQIFQKMGQYSLGGADEIRRAMSKKKKYIIEENREIFVHGGNLENHDTHTSTPVAGAESIGIPAQFAYDVYDSIQDFAKYGFNKSHAAVYAKTAYITAWLKYRYPVEFFTAYINTVDKDKDKLEEALKDARRNGVKIVAPDINRSRGPFTCDHEAMYYGFNRLGLAEKIKSETHDYTGMDDFIIRTSMSKKTIVTLIEAGAFDRFTSSRTALKKVLPAYLDYKTEYEKAAEKYNDYTRLLADMDAGLPIDKANYGMKNRKTLPSRNQILTTIDSSRIAMQDAEALIKAQVIPDKQFPDDMLDKLNAEKRHLKAYISGHPLEVYGTPESYNCVPLGNPQQGSCHIMGIVSNLRVTTQKKDPTKQMAFFTLEDLTGSIPVCVFSEAYANCDQLMLENNAVLLLNGYIKQDTRSNDGTLQFVVDKNKDSVRQLTIAPFDVTANISGIEALPEMQRQLSVYANQDGHPVMLFDQTTGEFLRLDMKVSDQAISTGLVSRLL